ncbi:hypothetical protein [Pedobacter sp. GR22-6]|uniref:hypothetical protein n=1 Tax=Pedobacter sp. GR22-6 TaxID=3127957 RepID=UPI00307E8F72
MKTILPTLNGIALVFTIVINYLSNSGMLNGNTMKTMSDKYFNYFTPAGYAFSIWGLIYLGLLGFVIYTGRSIFRRKQVDPVLSAVGWWFVLSCCANSFWVFAWLYDYTGLSVFIMLILLLSLLKIIVNTRMELDGQHFKRYLFIYWPFALYSGWISVALIANMAAYLTKINWTGCGISEAGWTVMMICIAGMINIIMIMTRNLREYGMVGIWALVAIAISNSQHQGPSSIIYTCYGVAVAVFAFVIVSGLKNSSASLDRM